MLYDDYKITKVEIVQTQRVFSFMNGMTTPQVDSRIIVATFAFIFVARVLTWRARVIDGC